MFIVLWQATTAQNTYISIPLPTGTPLDKRLKTDMKVDNENNVWMTFGSKKYGTSVLTSSIGLAFFNGVNWATWTTDNSALPTNSLTCVEPVGSVTWIGTTNGLVKKDGSTWTVYNKTNSGIVSDSITDVSVSGTIVWIATQEGVSKFDGSTWTNYTTSTHDIADNKINTILAGANGSVLIGTNKGISQLTGNTWTSYTTANSGLKTDKIFTLEQTTDGAVWIGADTSTVGPDIIGGVYILKNNTIAIARNYAGDCGVKGYQNAVYSIGTKGNHVIVPSALMRTWVYSDIQFMELGANTSTTYQSRSTVSFPVAGLFCAVSPSQKIFWCGRDGIQSDSLFSIDLNLYNETESGPTHAYLNINKVSTPILNRGDMFWDLQNAGYEAPKGSCKKALFASTLWIGGVSTQNLRVAAQTYRQNGNDYFAGPLRVGSATTDAVTMQQYDRIWRVNRQTIEEFKTKYAAGKVTDGSYPVPENILSWPAHGDSAAGFAANLAPFIDANNDGKYNPMDGDYPNIKGDQQLFWIFNDNGGVHAETGGSSLGVEVHASAYGYTCDQIQDQDSNTALNYTTFYEYEVINRGTQLFDTIKYGLWTDVDLGNYNDDRIGCNPKKAYGYGYNGDDNDDGITGYGLQPPAIGVAIMDQGPANPYMSGFIYYNNDFSNTGNPSRPEHYWYYLNNTWKDHFPVTYGGSGRGGSDTSSYMFPGLQDPAGRPEWSEVTAQFVPGDRRMVQVLSAPGSFSPGSTHKIEFAIVFSQAQTGGAMASATKLDTDIDKIRNWYANQSFPSCLDLTTGMKTTQGLNESKLTVYPNPANQSISLTAQGLSSNTSYTIIDITGRVLLSGKASSTIGVQDLQQGVYFVEVRDGNKLYVSKFIKN
jgi:hypothetical protein